MKRKSIGYVLLLAGILGLAVFLSWNLLNPKEVDEFYESVVGATPQAPPDSTYTRTTIHFKKMEEDKK